MESGCEIPDVVIDRAYRIGKGYEDKTRNVPYKNITVRFQTKNAKVRLDLTKKGIRYLFANGNPACSFITGDLMLDNPTGGL